MENLKGTTILVIGAGGFLGQHLLHALRREQANIHAVCRGAMNSEGAIQWWQGTATDLDWLRRLANRLKPAVIYQLASASFGGQNADLVLPTFENDLRTSVNALLCAKECGANRVILTRSLDERLPGDMAAPQSPYAAAKAASGLYGKMFYELYGVPVVMLRPYMAYGPGQKTHKVIPYVVSTMLKGEIAKLSSGSRLLDWIYVEDIISAFIASATRPEAAGKEIDLGTGVLTSVRDVVAQIHYLIPDGPQPVFQALPDRVNETVRTADLRTAEQTLGWMSTTPLKEGLRQTVDWYRKSGFQVDNSYQSIGDVRPC